MQKIGIVGLWTENNYGAVLNAWALYIFLEECGYTPYFVEFQDVQNRNTKSGEFIRSRCNIRDGFVTIEDAFKLNSDTDIFLVGSDQCWKGGKTTERFGFRFFLNFVDDEKKKISYATSCGEDEFQGDEEERNIALTYLERFDSVSVREKSTSEIYAKKLGKDVRWCIDSAFLNTRDEYKALLEDKSENDWLDGFGVLGFFLNLTQQKINIAKQTGTKRNANTEILLGEDFNNDEQVALDGFHIDCGIYTFLNAINRAQYVVTDSYHGLVFCLIFHKPFTVIINNNRGRARFVSLLEYLDLSDRAVEPGGGADSSEICEPGTIDWSYIDKKIEIMTADSKEWLLSALNEEKTDVTSGNNHYEIMTGIEDRYIRQKCRISEMEKRLEELSERIGNEFNVLKNNIVQSRAARIRYYIDNLVKENDAVAIRGAGEHTVHLLDLMDEIAKKKNVIIKYVIDRSKPDFELPEKCRYITPQDFQNKASEVDRVIISSTKYGDEMKREILEFFPEEMVIDPYDAFAPGELLPRMGWYDV